MNNKAGSDVISDILTGVNILSKYYFGKEVKIVCRFGTLGVFIKPPVVDNGAEDTLDSDTVITKTDSDTLFNAGWCYARHLRYESYWYYKIYDA